MAGGRSRGLARRSPWWGRLETRITIALLVIGISCVGASSYLVVLTVRYYDGLGEQQVANQRVALELAKPFFEQLAEAQREAFEARTEQLPHELAALQRARRDDAAALPDTEAFLRAWLDTHDDAQEVMLQRPGREPLVVTRDDFDEGAGVPVPIERPLDPALEPRVELGGVPQASLELDDELRGWLRVTWVADPEPRERHQRLGELERDLGTVEVADAGGQGRQVERDVVRQAVVRALSVASGLVLLVAILAGVLLARRTTRKVSDLSEVMRRVASGDLSVRAPRLGADELGQLAAAFNFMLDELEHTRRRIAYLQRIGAWQEMARRIAHEIKNPLTPIQLAVQQLREKDPRSDPRFSTLLRDSVEIVEDEVEGLRRMVTSFSQFAKLPEVELEEVELARIFSEFQRAYGRLGEDEGDESDEGELEVVAPQKGQRGETLRIRGDRQLLKQVLVNLVENASLSMREHAVAQPRVRLSGGELGERGLAYFVVEDSGPGISPERRDLVFEPYQTTRPHGTGLGLAIVKKIVLDHGGEIVVGRSEALGGARFEVRIPLVSAGPT